MRSEAVAILAAIGAGLNGAVVALQDGSPVTIAIMLGISGAIAAVTRAKVFSRRTRDADVDEAYYKGQADARHQ